MKLTPAAFYSPGGTGFQPVGPRSTIAASGLNFRVRDGIGWGP